MFDIQKMIQVVNHVIDRYDGRINYTKLIKELYLADKECLLKNGYLITDNNLVCMKMGPVLENLYRLIRGEHANSAIQTKWNSFFYKSSFDLVKLIENRLPEDRLNMNEIQILDDVDNRCHNMTYSELTDMVHDAAICPETIKTDSSVDLPLGRIMKKAGISSATIAAWSDEKELQDDIDFALAN